MKKFIEWMDNKEENEPSLKEEMMGYLKNQYKGLEDVNSKDFLFDMEAAIYYFATDYHSGQSSELYRILSTSDYRPGMMSRGIDSEPETVQMLYKSLEEKFKNV